MSAFEQLRIDMDAQVNLHLGDSISAELTNGQTIELTGFVTRDADAPSFDSMTTTRRVYHLRIDRTPEHRALLPEGLGMIRRLNAPLLPYWCRPAANSIANDGDAWICDLQKAPDQ